MKKKHIAETFLKLQKCFRNIFDIRNMKLQENITNNKKTYEISLKNEKDKCC